MNSKQLPTLAVDNRESTLDTILPAPAKWSGSSKGFPEWSANIAPPTGEENNSLSISRVLIPSKSWELVAWECHL
ncbi:hypothetical protein [Denitratisoma oestradiolicum]|uniref:hypothetical protein n=1 Tax=Denitratisoma oestradiolicum TaxID=311182 RepID=UPI0011A814B5|nr:hypothetical protein [Denitratisoma oestradiolicum]